jgi:hypothetical protein
MKRAAMLGKHAPSDALDMTAPLDVLLAHGGITRDQWEAGWAFAAMTWWAYGRPFPRQPAIVSAIEGRGVALSFAAVDSSDGRQRYERLRRCRDALFAAGERAYRATVRAAVDQRFASPQRTFTGKWSLLPLELQDIRRGLDALDKALTTRKAAAA